MPLAKATRTERIVQQLDLEHFWFLMGEVSVTADEACIDDTCAAHMGGGEL